MAKFKLGDRNSQHYRRACNNLYWQVLIWQSLPNSPLYSGLDLKAYKEALNGAYKLTLKYLKFLFIGPPRSGKSTMRRRLMKEIINLHTDGQSSDSTGASEGTEITIMTKKIVSEHAAIAIAKSHTEVAEGTQGTHTEFESQWKAVKTLEGNTNNAGEFEGSNDRDIHSLTHLFFKLISTCDKNSPDTLAKNEKTMTVSEWESEEATMSSVVEQESEDNNVSSDISLDSNSLMLSSDEKSKNKAEAKPSKSETLQKTDQEVEEAFNQLATILKSDSPEKLERLLKDLELIMINMMDIGGQPALLEMLPPLTIGPALYLLFFRLDQELNKSYKVKFRAPDSEEEIHIGGHYCIKDVVHQSLSSIACFGCYSQEEKMSSKILLCGTYKDKAKDKKVDISSMEKELRNELKETKFSTEGLLLDASHTDLFLSVDNMYGTEEEISKIRRSIENIIKDHFAAIKVPAVWLMSRVVLHLMKKPIVTLSQCMLIFERLSKQVEESSVEESSVKAALRFFHRNVGSLMYYDKIPSMQDIVICDPQVVMDSVSKLIFDRFTGVNLSCDLDGFKKGQFSFDQIADTTKEKRSMYLNIDQLIDLLKHLNILAEIEEIKQESEHADIQGSVQAHKLTSIQADEQRRKQSDDQERNQANRKFIMPAVLPIASDEELNIQTKRKYHKRSIMIHFSCGFIPFGVFSACMAYLIEPSNVKSSKWELSKLHEDIVWRNKVTFAINTKFFATLISRPQYFDIQISGYESTTKKYRKEFLDICPIVLRDVTTALRAVISKMKYNPYMMNEKSFFSGPLFHLAFPCCLDDSHSGHLMKVEISDGELTCTCLQQTGMEVPGPFSPEHLVWFDMVRVQCLQCVTCLTFLLIIFLICEIGRG